MRTVAQSTPWALAVPRGGPSNGRGLRALSYLLGAGFTLVLFLGIAHYQRSAPKVTPVERDEIRVAVVPAEPPPPPRVETIPEAEVPPMVGFKLSRSDSEVKISVSPPEAAALLPEDLSKAPPANAPVDFWATPRPRMDALSDPNHVFDKSEVDKVPRVLARTDPRVPADVAGGAVYLSCTLISIIDANGDIGSVRLETSSGNPRFDALIIDNFRDWTFSPAVKAGRKVRCMIEQAIRVKCATGSPFET